MPLASLNVSMLIIDCWHNSIFFIKFLKSKFSLQYLDSEWEKCIQMTTNKPCIDSIAVEIISQIQESILKFKLFTLRIQLQKPISMALFHYRGFDNLNSFQQESFLSLTVCKGYGENIYCCFLNHKVTLQHLNQLWNEYISNSACVLRNATHFLYHHYADVGD